MIDIAKKYIPSTTMIAMVVELDKEVGQNTENNSLRDTLAMLKNFAIQKGELLPTV